MERCQTDGKAVKNLAEASRRLSLLFWPWLRYALLCFLGCFSYCFGGICFGMPFLALVAAGKSPFVPLEAAEKAARQQEERSAKTKKKQKGKNGRKQKRKSERSEPPTATLPPMEEA